MAISVGVANPGSISGVDVAHPGTLKGPSNGVYWVGADGKVYVKGSQGTNAAGTADANTNSYWSSRGFDLISDPNPPKSATSIGSIYGRSAAPVYAPRIDIASINAQARAAAEGSVNPYYTRSLNEFLDQQAKLKAQQEAQTQTTITNAEDVLKNTLAGNEIGKTRTAEDTATKLAGINTQADQFQTDSGTQFDKDRIELAKASAAGGLTGGIAAQKSEDAQTNQATAEERQVKQYQDAKDQQELFKTRTFEDLARSGELATQSKEKGVKQANFDLDTYITNQNYNIQKTKEDLEKSRLEDIARNEQAQRALKVAQWIESISNPAQRAAAYSTYGGYL